MLPSLELTTKPKAGETDLQSGQHARLLPIGDIRFFDAQCPLSFLSRTDPGNNRTPHCGGVGVRCVGCIVQTLRSAGCGTFPNGGCRAVMGPDPSSRSRCVVITLSHACQDRQAESQGFQVSSLSSWRPTVLGPSCADWQQPRVMSVVQMCWVDGVGRRQPSEARSLFSSSSAADSSSARGASSSSNTPARES